jgi:hypothetical protein
MGSKVVLLSNIRFQGHERGVSDCFLQISLEEHAESSKGKTRGRKETR